MDSRRSFENGCELENNLTLVNILLDIFTLIDYIFSDKTIKGA